MQILDSTISAEVKSSVMSTYYVVCGVSGARIVLSELLYWNVRLQKAYSDPALIPISDFYPHLVADTLETTNHLA